MAELKLQQIALGIRHRRMFQIPEISGGIIDALISNTDSPFSRDKFTATRPLMDLQNELKGRVLIAEDDAGEGDSLAVDIDNVVITVKGVDKNKVLNSISEAYLPVIKKEIFENFDVRNINRIGLIFDFVADGSELVNKILKLGTNNFFGHPEVLNFAFSEKSTDPLSYVLKEYFDYQNHIVSIRKNETGPVQIKYDFQVHFNPEVESINDIELQNFIKSANELSDSKFLAMINSYEV